MTAIARRRFLAARPIILFGSALPALLPHQLHGPRNVSASVL